MDQITINVTETVENVTVQVTEGGYLPRYESWLQEDVSIGENNEWTQGPHLTLSPGIYHIIAQVILKNSSTGITKYYSKISGIADYNIAVDRGLNYSGYDVTLVMNAIVAISEEETVAVFAAVSNQDNAIIVSIPSWGTSVRKATGIMAIKIG
jgi:hypothetical protein